MPRVMIRCPSTGKNVPTGLSIDAQTWNNPTNTFENNSVGCSECGQTHTWSKADAFLED